MEYQLMCALHLPSNRDKPHLLLVKVRREELNSYELCSGHPNSQTSSTFYAKTLALFSLY
jgi:hypothetical protein